MNNERSLAAKILSQINPHNINEVGQYLHDDVIMQIPFASGETPQELKGKTAVMEVLQFIPNTFQVFSINVHESYYCPSRNTVCSEATSVGRLKSGSYVYQNRYLFLMEFSEGKVVLWREYFNPHLVEAMPGGAAAVAE